MSSADPRVRRHPEHDAGSRVTPHDPDIDSVWRFVRGDTPPDEFARWTYSHDALEPELGPDLYLEVISADLRDRETVFRLRQRLREWAEHASALPCRCLTLADRALLDMG